MSAPTPAPSWTARTPWRSAPDSALRSFLHTETGSAALLLAATLVALLWANLHGSSYTSFWHTEAAVSLGGSEVALDLREWVNSGLMTFFFFVVGLEARREFDMGDLRERQRVALPVLAGIGGMLIPVLIYLLVNAGRSSAHGWGAAMSTDTAFALGMLALVGRELPERLRSFMLTFTVVDDLVALAVIALVYSSDVHGGALLLSLLVFAVIVAVRAAKVRIGAVYALLGVLAWLAVLESGVDPVVVGLAMGLLTIAYPADRGRLEEASGLFRSFREQPTPELARSAQVGVRAALSPNERLQLLFHPWTSYVIVPLFALANIGIPVSIDFLREAATSPITLGIVLGYVVGKPIAVLGVAALVARLSGGRLQPPVGWIAVAGAGTIAGLGFTVSLLVATLAFSGAELDQAKLGVLTAAVVSSAITWLVFRLAATLPPERRSRALLGTVGQLVDLAVPVDHHREHVRGPVDAPVTVVEYGDFECPYCGQAEPAVRELLADFGDEVRYVWRHLPLSDVHPLAQQAAEASEAAADQGAFWPMHDALLAHQGDLRMPDLLGYAAGLGLDLDRFRNHLRLRAGAERVARDVESADLSGVSGTPTFFINGRRHHGAYDISSLTQAVRTARVRVGLTP